MSCKKVVVCSLVIGTVMGMYFGLMSNSLDYKIRYLKRKVNCLNRKINRVLNNMSEENLKKYKEELIKGYENIKNKVDNITIRDIKDKGNQIISSILDSIENLKEKLIAYAN